MEDRVEMISRRKFSKSVLATGAALLASKEMLSAGHPSLPADWQSAGRTPRPRMTTIRGLVHTPPTPYTSDNRIDTDTFQKLVDFMIRHGADVFSHPMHVGEVLALTTEERRMLAKLTVEAVNGRVPCLIHTSFTGTKDAVEASQHAQSVGADGVCVTTPYYWFHVLNAPNRGIIEHFVKVGTSIDIALVAYHNERAGAMPPSVYPEILRRCPNFIGLKDAECDPRYLAAVSRVTYPLRPEFGILAGGEFPLFTMPAGGTGCCSPLGFIAPRLVRALMDACVAGDYKKAAPLQWKVSELTTIIGEFYSYSSTMAVMEMMGRPCGKPRLPVATLDADAIKRLEAQLSKSGVLDGEPHGWA
jgi:dihydrodipicolinate synthase/N-acetylneuraminate lyase